MIDFLTTALVENPRRVGKPLRGDLAGIWSARRGTYRVLYRLREDPREVIVIRVDHRKDAYRHPLRNTPHKVRRPPALRWLIGHAAPPQ